MVEDTSASALSVTFRASVEPGRNIGRRGADLTRGHRVLRTGDVLTPSRVGVLAALGRTHVEVFGRPTVFLISTGDEIVQPGAPLHAGQLYDVNQFTLASIVERHGGLSVPWRGAGDTREDLLTALDAAAGHDIAVFSGGSSVGTRDLVVDAVRERGEVLLHGIAVKPGKPTLFAQVQGTPVFGMPGYPTSCLSNAYLLLAPFLRAVARLPAWRPETITLPLSAAIRSVTGRHQFYSVRIRDGRAEPAFKSSGDITSLAEADGYIEILAETDRLETGENVTVTLFH
jgi:molybdenum cofactor synthesis domain-containing protein